MLSLRANRPGVRRIDTSYGTENTPDVSAWGGTKISRWDFESGLDMSRTDGYTLLPPSERGLVVTDANSKHATVDAGVGYQISNAGRAFIRGTFFRFESATTALRCRATPEPESGSRESTPA